MGGEPNLLVYINVVSLPTNYYSRLIVVVKSLNCLCGKFFEIFCLPARG